MVWSRPRKKINNVFVFWPFLSLAAPFLRFLFFSLFSDLHGKVFPFSSENGSRGRGREGRGKEALCERGEEGKANHKYLPRSNQRLDQAKATTDPSVSPSSGSGQPSPCFVLPAFPSASFFPSAMRELKSGEISNFFVFSSLVVQRCTTGDSMEKRGLASLFQNEAWLGFFACDLWIMREEEKVEGLLWTRKNVFDREKLF